MLRSVSGRLLQAAPVVIGFGSFGGNDVANCAPTKPKGAVWKAYTDFAPQTAIGPSGLKCIGDCGKVFWQATPNATVLARHSVRCMGVSTDMRAQIQLSHSLGDITGGKTIFVHVPTDTGAAAAARLPNPIAAFSPAMGACAATGTDVTPARTALASSQKQR